MNEREIKRYKKYIQIRNNKKVNWINRIRFWKYLQDDYKTQLKEIKNKEDNKHYLKLQLKVAEQTIQELEADKKKKKQSK